MGTEFQIQTHSITISSDPPKTPKAKIKHKKNNEKQQNL